MQVRWMPLVVNFWFLAFTAIITWKFQEDQWDSLSLMHIPEWWLKCILIHFAREWDQDLSCLVQVEWNSPEEPQKGFKYVYLTAADYHSICDRTHETILRAKPISVNGESNWQCMTIILPRNEREQEKSRCFAITHSNFWEWYHLNCDCCAWIF